MKHKIPHLATQVYLAAASANFVRFDKSNKEIFVIIL